MLAISSVDRDRGSRLSFPEVTHASDRRGALATGLSDGIVPCRQSIRQPTPSGRRKMAVASVSKITAASPTSFDAAIQEGLARANRTLRGITGLHVIEEKASVKNGKIDEYRVTMEVTFILEG